MHVLPFQQSNQAIESIKHWRARMRAYCLSIWGMLKFVNFSKEFVTGKRILTHTIHPLDAAASIGNLPSYKEPHKKIRNKYCEQFYLFFSSLSEILWQATHNSLSVHLWNDHHIDKKSFWTLAVWVGIGKYSLGYPRVILAIEKGKKGQYGCCNC